MLNRKTTNNQISPQSSEIYFKGTISHGKNFKRIYQGLCCELLLIHTDNWKLQNSQKAIQTHISYKNDFNNEFVWSQNFEFYFTINKFEEWPIGILRLWNLNSNNKLKIVGYSKFKFPLKSGFSNLECNVVKPLGDYEFFEKQFYDEDNGELCDLDTLKLNDDTLQLFNAESNGKVFMEIEVVKRYFKFDN